MKFVAFLLFFVSYSSMLLSCDCITSVGYEDAKFVFVGRVVKVVERGMYKVTFKICEMEKGELKKRRLSVDVPCLMEACCGIAFKVNEKYRVYTILQDDKLQTNLCTETAKIE